MLEPFDQIHRTLTSRNERKELLVLACAVDRMAWGQACRPTRNPRAEFAHEVLGYLDTISSFLPGRFGRWLRGASFLADLGRQFGWLKL